MPAVYADRGRQARAAGKTQSQGAISAKSVSGDIQIAGPLWSQASLDLWAGGNISLLAQVSAGALGNVSVTAQGLTLNAGAVLSTASMPPRAILPAAAR